MATRRPYSVDDVCGWRTRDDWWWCDGRWCREVTISDPHGNSESAINEGLLE